MVPLPFRAEPTVMLSILPAVIPVEALLMPLALLLVVPVCDGSRHAPMPLSGKTIAKIGRLPLGGNVMVREAAPSPV